jgi:hypothetical protein
MNSLFLAIASIVIVVLSGIVVAVIWNRLIELRRVLSIRRWVTHFICVHYGRVEDLTIHCSNDHEVPIAAGFDIALTGIRHLLSFSYGSGKVPCSFQSEKRESIGLRTPKLSPAVIVQATLGRGRALPKGFLRVFCRENVVRAGRPIG